MNSVSKKGETFISRSDLTGTLRCPGVDETRTFFLRRVRGHGAEGRAATVCSRSPSDNRSSVGISRGMCESRDFRFTALMTSVAVTTALAVSVGRGIWHCHAYRAEAGLVDPAGVVI